jgi:6-phosphogluconolactonase
MSFSRFQSPPCEIAFGESPEALASSAAADLQTFVASRSAAGRTVLIALSGGRIAQHFFQAAAEAFAHSKVGLSNVHFFWADERCVPPTDPESNFRLADELLLQPLGVCGANIHRIQSELEPTAAATAAELELRNLCEQQGRAAEFDLILLGMGEDGHVASLFPGESPAQMSNPALYRAVVAVKPPPHRVTLGYSMLLTAGQVWVLASGAGKEGSLRASLEPDARTPLGRMLSGRSLSRVYTDLTITPG